MLFTLPLTRVFNSFPNNYYEKGMNLTGLKMLQELRHNDCAVQKDGIRKCRQSLFREAGLPIYGYSHRQIPEICQRISAKILQQGRK
jgi:hypothetical protein